METLDSGDLREVYTTMKRVGFTVDSGLDLNSLPLDARLAKKIMFHASAKNEMLLQRIFLLEKGSISMTWTNEQVRSAIDKTRKDCGKARTAV